MARGVSASTEAVIQGFGRFFAYCCAVLVQMEHCAFARVAGQQKEEQEDPIHLSYYLVETIKIRQKLSGFLQDSFLLFYRRSSGINGLSSDFILFWVLSFHLHPGCLAEADLGVTSMHSSCWIYSIILPGSSVFLG